jgi:hypothetical protein
VALWKGDGPCQDAQAEEFPAFRSIRPSGRHFFTTLLMRNADRTAAAAEMMKGMDATQAQQAIESACNGAAAGVTLPMALQAN